ncbi:MAG: type II toxin-antitoxin system VapC family toxin [Beijerinckiaceae bacterium]
MIHYLDTSVLIAAFAREAEADRVFDWIAGSASGGLAISPWVSTEFSSALAIKVRRSDMPPEERNAALADFRTFVDSAAVVWALENRHFRDAAALCDRPDLSLRAGDALHLALVLDRGSALLTSDRTLFAAARALGAIAVMP